MSLESCRRFVTFYRRSRRTPGYRSGAGLLAGLALVAASQSGGAACARAETPVSPPVSPPVIRGASAPARMVRVEAPAALRDILEQSLDPARRVNAPVLGPTQVRALAARLPAQARGVLEALGYFSARIEAGVDETVVPSLVWLQVEPGEPVRVTQVRIEVTGAPDGAAAAALAGDLRRAWSLPEGHVFVSADWDKAKADALLGLVTRNFAGARIVASRAEVDPQRHSAALQVQFDTGPAYRFGATTVEGLRRYPESVVRRLQPWQVGDEYVQAKLLDDQAALQDSGYFRTAVVAAPLAGASGAVLPVSVSVTERRTQRVGLGTGYSSNTGARVQADYTNRDLLNRAWILNTRLRVETRQQSLGADVTFPHSFSKGRYSIGAEALHNDIQGLTTRSQTLAARRQRVDGPIETEQSLTFINEQQQISGGGVSGNMALMPGYRWIRRRLDNPLDPKQGNLVSAEISGGSKALLSDQDFVRLLVRGVQYLSLGSRDQLILRGEVGNVFSASAAGIPQRQLFRAGGIGSVRGYAYQSLGLTQDGAVVGGRAVATASIEGVHWVAPRWGAALFCDAGNAADSFATLHPVVGCGAGVRWRSPAGVIAVDLARAQTDGALRMQFNVGVSF